MSNGDWSALDFTEVSDNKPAAGLLGLFCGSFGIHKIVLGSTKEVCSRCSLVVSACFLGDDWNTGFHPFALLGALLPLQLAVVLWCI
jgi:hypothetical protein